MAGDWIKMRNDLADDPAVIGMASMLGVDEFSIVGRLHRFWSWSDRHSRDGHAAGVTKAWLDRYVQCDGFADAMESFGWLVIENGGITVPNFDRHNGESAKKRGLATERKRKQRAVTDVSTDMSRNERDESVTREEKRREESSSLRSEDKPRKRVAPPDGVSESVWDDFLKLRKAKKAPMTESALETIKREADKAGWTLENALRECCARGWQGFKADWVLTAPRPVPVAANGDIARMTVPSKPGRDPALVRIEQDMAKAAPIPEAIRERLAALKGAVFQ